ncbi:hypothetical protein ABPG72_000857 [Tetrahymena utriculariae]
MPIVSVNIKNFFKKLGKELTFHELEELCFEYGIEVEEKEVSKKNKKSGKEEKVKEYAFEVGANRPDLLSVETLTQALGVFIGTRKPPQYTVKPVEKRQKIIVKKDCKRIRPFVVGAVLRNVTFTQESYDSFIDFQDKLHHNLCRRRRLVAIGTHDLDTIQDPFIYDARDPAEIKFVPLDKTECMDGNKLMEFFEKDSHLKDFLPIIRNSPVYPVILDSNDVVCSLPPIINGDHSKIKLTTKNVFIESTATDYTRALIALNCLVAAFSEYCAEPYTVEEVEIHYEEENRTDITPQFTINKFQTKISHLNSVGSINVTAEQACKLLERMSLTASVLNNDEIEVSVPITRGDILQECDIIEDVCIAYGFKNIKAVLPKTPTVGKQLLLNKMSDLIREEIAAAGYKEGLNFVLVSRDDLTKKLKKENDEQMIIIDNPKTEEFSVGRTTLLPGCLKWLSSNKKNKIPISMFEVGDVILKDDTRETNTRNERRLCALYTNHNSELEVVHGLLDYIMLKLMVTLDPTGTSKAERRYRLVPSDEPTYFLDRQAHIYYNDKKIGNLGILHPDVVKNFEWKYPVSTLELNLEPLIYEFHQ